MADRLGELFQALERLDHGSLRDVSVEGHAALLSTLTTTIFRECAAVLPKYRLGRALIGTGSETLDYDPESPLIGPPIRHSSLDVQTVAALFGYIHLSKTLQRLGRGGAITRRLLKQATGSQRLIVVSLSDEGGGFVDLSGRPMAELRSAFDEILPTIASRLHARGHGSAFHEDAALYHDLPDHFDLPDSPRDLSDSLVRAWFDAAEFACYWLCGDPFPSDPSRWGGLYFIGNAAPTPDELNTTGILSREIFLRANLIERTRAAARVELFDELRDATKLFAMHYGHLADLADAARTIVSHADPLSEDISAVFQARQLTAQHVFDRDHKIAAAEIASDISARLSRLIVDLEPLCEHPTVRRVQSHLSAVDGIHGDHVNALRVAKAVYRLSISVNALISHQLLPKDETVKAENVEGGWDLRLAYALVVLLRRWVGRTEVLLDGKERRLRLLFPSGIGDWPQLKLEIRAWWEGKRSRSSGGDDSRDLACVIRGLLGSTDPTRLSAFLERVTCAGSHVVVPLSTRVED